MAEATIEGVISTTGYLHLKYDMQVVNEIQYRPYDIVITPRDEKGTVSFPLPQGIRVKIEWYPSTGGLMEKEKTVIIPKSARVALKEL